MEGIKTDYTFYKECEELLDKRIKIINNSVAKYKEYDLCGRTG